MSEAARLLGKAPTELTLDEVMSGVPVDLEQLEKVKIGKNCNAEVLSRLCDEDQEKVTSLSEQLKASLDIMLLDESKTVFHDCLKECSVEIERAIENPAASQANFNWVPHDLPHELMDVVTDKWDQARSLYKNFLDEDKIREKKWAEVIADVSREFTSGTTSQPELEQDSLEEKKLGWNREWTWRRRAQFNWGVQTLMQGLATKDEFHVEARRRIASLQQHLPFIESSKHALKVVNDAFWDMTTDRAPRAYQNKVVGVIDSKQGFIKELNLDVDYLEKELSIVHDANLNQRAHFEKTEVTGGTTMVTLQEECEALRAELSQLPLEKQKAIESPTSRLADLKNKREEEVQRALKKSQDFLAENMKLQNECKEQLEAIDSEFKEKVRVVEDKIRANEESQRQAQEEHHRKAVERLDNEAKRCELIKHLVADAEDLIKKYKQTIVTNEVEAAFPKTTMIPFCHSFTLTLLNCQRDYLLELSDYEEVLPGYMSRLIKPTFILRARLCSSLIQACNDIDEIIDACKVQIEFCNGM